MTKVSQNYSTTYMIIHDEYIFGLDISMCYSILMKIMDCARNLSCDKAALQIIELTSMAIQVGEKISANSQLREDVHCRA